MSLPETVHASAVAIGAHGVLVRGASGSGKSSLVLGLIDRDPAATRLVADDRVELAVARGVLVARAPTALAGKLEVRGLGIVDIAHVSPVAIALVVDLLPPDRCPRMPEPAEMEANVMGVVLPRLMLPIGVGDAAARVRFALGRLVRAARPETAIAPATTEASCVAESIGQDSAPRRGGVQTPREGRMTGNGSGKTRSR